MHFIRSLCGALLPVALGGCAVMDSIHWKFPGPNGSDVFTVDAKQRHLIIAKGPNGSIRACAEAAPDAFSAYSSSLTGSLGRGSADARAEAASAFASTAATIERTQTVNLLRESMYRTCERWLSGMIGDGEFLTQSARDSRSMVAVLAIEQLTGVVKAPSTIISGPAVSASLKQGKELTELVSRYGKERATAADAATSSEAALAAADKDYTADGKTVKICTLGEAPPDPTAAANWSACKSAETKAKAARQSAADSKERELLVLKQLGDLSSGLAAATSAGTMANPAFAAHKLTKDELEKITTAVTEIVLTPGIDEALLFCIGYLNRTFVGPDDTRATCNSVVAASANQSSAVRQQLLSSNITVSDVSASATRISDYDIFKTGVRMLIARTPSERWDEFWKPFASKLTVQGPDCSTKTSCALVWAGSLPYYSDFFDQPDGLKAAAGEWEKRLQANGS